MSSLSRQLAVGLDRVGKISGLAICNAAWKCQNFDASSWKKVRGPAGAVRCELRDVGMQWPVWDTFCCWRNLARL